MSESTGYVHVGSSCSSRAGSRGRVSVRVTVVQSIIAFVPNGKSS